MNAGHYYILYGNSRSMKYIDVKVEDSEIGRPYHSHCNLMYHGDDTWDFIATFDDVILLGVF